MSAIFMYCYSYIYLFGANDEVRTRYLQIGNLAPFHYGLIRKYVSLHICHTPFVFCSRYTNPNGKSVSKTSMLITSVGVKMGLVIYILLIEPH